MNVDWVSVAIGVIVTIVVGLPIAFFANWLFDRYKEYRKGKRPYIFITHDSGGMLNFEGSVWEDTELGTTIANIERQVLGESDQETDDSDTKDKSDESNLAPT